MDTPWTPWTDDLPSRTEIDDDTATELAWCELIQRRAWAQELGHDPDAVDLLALASVEPQHAEAA